MDFDSDKLVGMVPIETVADYSARDVILYALGVGVGVESAVAPETLRFVYEQDLTVLPTMASVIAFPGFWLKEPRYGIDWKRVVAAEEALTLHRPLVSEGRVVSITSVDDLFDKGAEKGALLLWRRELYDSRTGDCLATEKRASFLRGDGGKGGRREPAPAPPPVPQRPCDVELSLPTRPEQALIFRLSGDYNPLHIDPQIAREARFDRPILHGLCTYGVAARALLRALQLADVGRLHAISCRFASPVFPGETIITQIWRVRHDKVAFQCTAAERSALVLTHGQAEIHSEAACLVPS